MKIGIEGQRLFRKKKHGMDMVALELIKNLQRIDTVNEYVVFVKQDEDICLQDTDNFKIKVLEASDYITWEQFILPKAVKEEKCEILHCTSNTAPLRINVPLVLTLHDIIYLESISIFKKAGTWYQKFGNMYRRWIVPKVVKKAEKVITVSHFEKNRINDFFQFPKDNDKLVAIYNGVGEHFRPIKDKNILEKIKKNYDLPEKFFFFLGNTDPKKNVPNVLKAYHLFTQKNEIVPLVILDFDKNELQKILANLNAQHLMKHIQLLGYIPNNELPAIYTLADLFLYPSLRESFGIPILEAMACGTPVITSNTSSMPEVSGKASILVNPHKAEEICEAIENLQNNKDLYEEKIKQGLQQSKLFSWENMAKNVLKLYEKIA
jgi:glycosyltransferase involved in cell wall biosynthesis